jgi:ATP-dependent DNA helicase RecG
VDACRDSGLPEPLFENFSGGFRIKFMMPEEGPDEGVPLNGSLNGSLNQRILFEISNSPGIQRKTIVESLGVPDRTVGRYISELVSAGLIERRGSKKTGGYWAVPSA